MGRGPFIAYVDECGDTGIENYDPKNPVFVLCVALYRTDDYLTHDLPTLSRLKFKHWWHDAVVFHSYKIRSKVPPFQALKEEENFNALMTSIAAFFEKSTTTIIAAAIDKPRHRRQYNAPEDPYYLALQFCLERVYGHTYTRVASATDETMFVFEKRGNKENKLLEERFNQICDGRNRWERCFPFRISFAGKDENITGLQIADLAAYPIARYVETRNEKRKDWKAISHLIRTGPKGITGYGLKIFPE